MCRLVCPSHPQDIVVCSKPMNNLSFEVELLQASYILPSADQALIENGCIAWKGETILDVGSAAAVRSRYPDAPILDCSGQFLIPGLINAHDHGRAIGTLPLGVPDEPLEIWINGLYSLRPLDCYYAALYDGLNLIHSGVTTVVHQHNPRRWDNVEEELLETTRGYRDAGIRVNLGLPLMDQNKLFYLGDQYLLERVPKELANRIRGMGMATSPMDWQSVLTSVARLKQAWSQDDWAWYQWAPIGPQWCSDELLCAVKEAAGDEPVQTHLLETRYQQEYAQRKFGTTLVAHLAELSFLDQNVSCAHGVWLTDADIDLIAQSGAMIVHNPSSNLRLRSGICRVLDLLDAGVRVGIGLDGHGLNDDQDMLTEVRLAKGLAFEPGIDRRSLSTKKVFEMATQYAADVVAKPGAPLGKLAAGYAADCVGFRLERVRPAYLEADSDLIELVFRRVKPGDIDTVIVGGKPIIREGKHLWASVTDAETALGEMLARPKPPEQLEMERLAAELLPTLMALYSEW